MDFRFKWSLFYLGGDLLCNVLENLDAYEASAIVQDNSEATFAPVIDKSIALLDFNQQANAVKFL